MIGLIARFRPRKRWLSVSVGVIVLCGFSPHSYALKNVVILPFSGPRAETARKALIKSIASQINLIPYTTYREVAASIGVNGKTTRGTRAVCARLSCHAVLSGDVSKIGRKYQLKVVVRNGSNGRVLGTVSHAVRGRRLMRRAGISVSGESMALIERTSSASSLTKRRPKRRTKRRKPRRQRVARVSPPPAPPPVPVEPVETSVIQDDETASTAQEEEDPSSYAQSNYSDEMSTEDVTPATPIAVAEQIEERANDETPEEPPQVSSIFALAIGVGMARRDYQLKGSTATETSRYRGSVYPDVTISGEIFPLAAWVNNAAAKLGLEGSFNHHLSISTELPNVGDVDTSSMELKGGIFYDVDLPGWGGRTEIRTRVGLGSRTFDLGANNVLPSFDYKYIQIGAEASIPLGSQYIGILAGGDARPILAVGQEAVDAYGSSQSKFGWSIGAGLFGVLEFADRHQLRYFTRIELSLFSADFQGLAADGIPSRSVQEFPDRQEATSGVDQFVRLWAGVAYAY